jgi:hypothetical protein
MKKTGFCFFTGTANPTEEIYPQVIFPSIPEGSVRQKILLGDTLSYGVGATVRENPS